MDLKSNQLSASDFEKIASLHCEYINQGFLATLGIPFLTLLYEAIDNDSESILLVERIDDTVQGFVTGTRGLGRIYMQLLYQPLRLLHSLKSCLLSPSKMHKIIEVLLLGNSSKASVDLPKHELLSIVVSSACQGGGQSQNLFNALCDHFRKKNVRSFKIVVGGSLDRAHAFYIKMGCVPVKEVQVHKGTDSIIYIKEC